MWYQLKIALCAHEEVDIISQALEDGGALSITLSDKNDNPIFEPELTSTPLWPEVVIHALYATAEEAQAAKTALLEERPTLDLSIEVLPDKDWERVWMDEFKPQRFGKHLWICPTWSSPPKPKDINLILDPGLAFGTGSHPTTALCLEYLDGANLHGQSLIDYGCGSGVLALAALKLGAVSAFAVDIDPQALEACRNNAEINQIKSEQLTICFPDDLKTPVDMLIANILLSPLLSLKDRFKNLLKTEGLLIVSGLLEEQAPQLMAAYEGDFILKKANTAQNWSLLVFEKVSHD